MNASPTTLPLHGRAAVVTGAAQGLGAAMARGLAEAGARVALLDVDDAVQAQAEALRADGHDALALHADVRDESALSRAFEAAAVQFGGVDLMVNNAARTPTTSLWDITADEWDEVLAVNLRGCFFGCRVAGRHMRARAEAGRLPQGGRIINLASIAGQQASANAATGVHYAASKAGIVALTRSFAQALAPLGITVNALAPAAIRSPALDALDAERRQSLQAAVPVGRFGAPEEVAAAAVYLASAGAAFVTGSTLDLNGGRLMR